jgi:hypothetical protein
MVSFMGMDFEYDEDCCLAAEESLSSEALARSTDANRLVIELLLTSLSSPSSPPLVANGGGTSFLELNFII